MKRHVLALTAAISLACYAFPATAGSLDPALQAALSAAEAQQGVPVIIRFTDAVDVKAVRREARRLAREAHPGNSAVERKARRKLRRKLKRRMLVDALKTAARSSRREINRLLRSHGEKPKLKLLWARNSIAGTLPAHLLDEVAALPGVESVSLDITVQGPGDGTAPTAPSDWNLPATGVEPVWDTGNTGQDVVVATLDTGVDAAHPDLGPRWRGGANSWFDPHEQHAMPADVNGHGTQVMGLIVGGSALGYQIGMAPGAQWIAAKIFDNANESTLSAIHEAYQWVLDPDDNPGTDDAPDIVNNSWALQGTVDLCLQEFQEDIALLKAAEIAVVFSAGNYGPNADTSVSPANDPAVVSVGSVDSALNIDIQSSRGAGACDGGIYPHLVAPGDGVLTADRVPLYYNFVSGTSFAVAHLAGAMAVLKSAFPDATVGQLESALVETGWDLGPGGPDDDFGHGMLDVTAAYDWLVTNLGGGAPGTVQLGATSHSVDENVASLTVTVTRTGGSSGDVSVDYATGDGTATAGGDYQATSGTLDLLDGEVSGSFAVSILDDSLVEGDETFSVILSNAVGATLGSPADSLVTIIDEDALDSDGDGVGDALDLCPNTPAGEPVDADGCSASQLDADGDGVIDVLDLCSNTPASEPVDADGCSASQLDSDGDGVSDALDLCPGTPVGTAVDAVGCPVGPVDADGDGSAEDQDCNDDDPAVYPGAPEVKHDGVDQDCNGYDLTIDVTRARYVSRLNKVVVWATSELGAAAGLSMSVTLANGATVNKNLTWKASKGRWQKTVKNLAAPPVSVIVSGVEGEQSSAVEQR